jgi:transposase-like protein
VGGVGGRGEGVGDCHPPPPPPPPPPDPEVAATAKRRQFSASQKRRILAEAQRCTEPGQMGALLRREGIYSSNLTTWRKQREAAELAAMQPQKRGRKADPAAAEARRMGELTKDNERLRRKLAQAHTIIEDCGRNAGYPAPPAQIRTCPIRAFGSYLGCLTAKRCSGHG